MITIGICEDVEETRRKIYRLCQKTADSQQIDCKIREFADGADFMQSMDCEGCCGLPDILYIRSEYVYSSLRLKNGQTLLLREGLHRLEEILRGVDFVRIRRNCLVNVKDMDGQTEIEIIGRFPEHIQMEETDFCVLFFNMLENAKEDLQKIGY